MEGWRPADDRHLLEDLGMVTAPLEMKRKRQKTNNKNLKRK